MGKSQQTKGKIGEREVVKILESFGFMARRGQVWMGEGDIIAPQLPVWFEVKRHEELCLTEWFRQAAKDCGDKVPSVVYRQSRHPWTIYMRATDFIRLMSDRVIKDLDQAFITMKFEDFLMLYKETR